MSKIAIVDDRDPVIQYTGDWGNTGESWDFNYTARFPAGEGAQAIFTFTGTSVSVYGTVDRATATNFTFKLDDHALEQIQGDMDDDSWEHHARLWQSRTLDDGSHTLVMERHNRAISNVFLDYITYVPAANTTTDGLKYLVDDRDPSIQYSADWKRIDCIACVFHSRTTSNIANSSFQMQFDGVAISLSSLVSNLTQPPEVEIRLDNDASVRFAPDRPSMVTRMQIFFADNLEQKTHNIVVTLTKDQSFSLDSILVHPGSVSGENTDGSQTFSGSTTTSENTSTHLSSTSLTASLSFSQGSQQPNATSDATIHRRASVGAIVGGVIGGFLVLVLAIFGAVWYSKVRGRETDDHVVVQPYLEFNPPAFPSEESRVSRPQSAHSMGTEASEVDAPQPTKSRPYLRRVPGTPRGPRRPRPRPGFFTTSSGEVREGPVQHCNSGLRFGDGDSLPPSYSQT